MGTQSKRKNREEVDERPAKKVAVAPVLDDEDDIIVDHIKHIDNSSVLGPILVSTPGLGIPSHISFQAYKRSRILPKGQTTDVILQSSEHARLDYLAQEEKDGSSESQLSDYVGIYDPQTKKLQLMPVKRLTVRSTLRSETEELRNRQARIEAAQSTFTAKRHALAAEFGSKRSRKAIENMTMNAISRGAPRDAAAAKDEDMAQNILQGMSGATEAMPTRAELDAAVDSMKPRPRANLDAEHPIDVYTVDEVVGKDMMELIEVKDWVEASDSGVGVNVPSRFVAKRITKLAKNKSYQKLKVLRFILLCIKFNDVVTSKGKGPKKIPPKDKFESLMGEDVPGPLANTIRRKFASDNNDMPRWHVDNLMTHACAAALIVNDFEMDINDLREDLKLENKDIRQYFAELGARVAGPTETDRNKFNITKAESANHWIAKLKIPLRFPTLKKGPPKKR